MLENGEGDEERFAGMGKDIVKTQMSGECADKLSLLRLAEQKLRIGHWELDVSSNKLYWSDEIFLIHDTTPEEYTPEVESALDFYHGDDRSGIEKSLKQIMKKPGNFDFDCRLITQKKRLIYVRACGESIADKSGKIVKIIGLFQDITEYRQVHEELVHAKEKAERADRRKTDFMARMSHEIRTPMNAIIGISELMLQNLKDPININKANMILEAATGLLTIINDVLDISKVESGKMSLEVSEFNPAATISEVASIFSPIAEKKDINIKVNIDDKVPFIAKGDSLRIKQVLNNLTHNAIKFTTTGTVTIGLELLKKRSDRADVRFSVQDTGIGIPKEQIDSIFEKYTQVDKSSTNVHGGTGLGLSICKELAKLMNGTIDVSSQEGRGTTFILDIPLGLTNKTQSDSKMKKSVNDFTKYRFSNVKVLVVEDSLVNQMIAREILETIGCSVNIAENGQKAVEMFAKGLYDLVLMDCQMPIMDGYEATREIKSSKNGKQTPVIAMTANAMPADCKKCFEAGMDDFLSKPTNSKAISAMLNKWLPPEKIDISQLSNIAVKVKEYNGEYENAVNLEAIRQTKEIFDSRFSEMLRGNLTNIERIINELTGLISEKNQTKLPEVISNLQGFAQGVGAVKLAHICDKIINMCQSEEVFITNYNEIESTFNLLRQSFFEARELITKEFIA
jgi:signal transduction histidine kinase/DNA-binding NarL/FixJ family response regulator